MTDVIEIFGRKLSIVDDASGTCKSCALSDICPFGLMPCKMQAVMLREGLYLLNREIMNKDIEKIRAEIERLIDRKDPNTYLGVLKIEAYKDVLSIIDSMQEEPKKCMYSKDDYTDEDRKILCDGCDEECKYNKSDDFTKALAECIHQAQWNVVDPMVLAETWKDELIKLAKIEEPVSEELESEIQRYNNSLNLDAEENYEWNDIACSHE